MELYVLDSSLRRIAVIDRYDSLIWTERYTSAGDFQVVTAATDDAKSLLTAGQQLALNESNRIMKVEQVEAKDDSQGRSLLTVKGPSLEKILTERSSRSAGAGTVGDTTAWVLTDTPMNVARQIFSAICVTNTYITADRIPYYTAGSLYSPGNIAEDSSLITVSVPTDNVYNILKNLADAYGFGFRLMRGPDDSKLYFEFYTGSDRTTDQNDLGAVIFSRALGTLDQVAELSSISDYYNVAYVFHPTTSVIVYATGFENVTGFARRVLTVNGSNIDPTTVPDLAAALTILGEQELGKHQQLQAIDGQAPQESLYKYGIDYNLGDLVEMRDTAGNIQNMRVTEQIFASDVQGDRSYPTLVADIFVTPGSWAAWDSNEQWADEPDTSTWATP